MAISGKQRPSAHLQTPRLFEEPRRVLAPLGVPLLGAHCRYEIEPFGVSCGLGARVRE